MAIAPQWVDSHCHLNFLDDPAAAIDRARAGGIAAMLCIGVDESSADAVVNLAQNHADIWATLGVHPDSAVALDPSNTTSEWLHKKIHHPRVVAVGETGLDYLPSQPSPGDDLEDKTKQARQRHWFAEHLALAKSITKPVVVHTREAKDDTLALIRESGVEQGVLHCFTEDWDMAKQALDLGFYISISGIVTFKNAANVRDVATKVPLDRLLIETDSPWLAPVPMRGKTNEPAYVAHTGTYLADLLGIAATEFAAVTSANFYQAFGIDPTT